jgi:hypothetical protein
VDEMHHILSDAIFHVDFPKREKEQVSVRVRVSGRVSLSVRVRLGL